MQKNTNYRTYYFSVAMLLFYGLLYWHTWILYSAKLNNEIIALQAFYRLLVATLPLITTLWLTCSSGKIKLLVYIVWMFFIPYPFYNFFQLRHIAEIFTYRDTYYLTQSSSINEIWKILPTAVYAFSQLILFYFCLQRVTSKWPVKFRLLFVLAVCFYVSVCSSFGLSVRLDTYHLIINLGNVYSEFLQLCHNTFFIINTTVIFLFSCRAYQALNHAQLHK